MSAEKKAEHILLSDRTTPISVIARCICGWKYEASRQQNALARASKMKAAKRAHLARAERKDS